MSKDTDSSEDCCKQSPDVAPLEEFFHDGPSPRTSKRRGWRAFAVFVCAAAVATGLAALPVGASAMRGTQTAVAAWEDVPVLDAVDIAPRQRTVFLDSRGVPFARIFTEDRVPVTRDELPQHLVDAIVAAEDARFFEHNGLDVRSTIRAAIATLSGDSVQGGSGITQQYAKNLSVAAASSDTEAADAVRKTFDRKLVELKTAIALEQQYTKDDIVTGYFNTVYFGNGAYGIAVASQRYFSKKPAELLLHESALLSGIVNAPETFDPYAAPDAALERRAYVLDRMKAEGFITDGAYQEASQQPLDVLPAQRTKGGCAASKAPFYCQYTLDQLLSDERFGETRADRESALYRGGLRITTGLDLQADIAAKQQVSSEVDPQGRVAAAAAVVEPGTGYVTSLVVNRGYGTQSGQTEQVYPTVPTFQPGSTFKPFTAAAALETGSTPQLELSAPDRYSPPQRNAPPGGFRNAGSTGTGTFRMPEALRRSSNTWFVRLQDQVGVRRTATIASRMGVTSLPLTGDRALTERDASLTLGSYETSPLEVASAYATLAANGLACQPTPFVSVQDGNGKTIDVSPQCTQVLQPSTAVSVTKMLVGVVDSGDPLRTGKRASLGRPVAGKTGTTDNSAAAWFAGYTPQRAAAVWFGDPRGGSAHPLDSVTYGGETFTPVYGGGAPALMWRDVMREQHRDLPRRAFRGSAAGSALGTHIEIPDVRGLTVEDAYDVLQRYQFTPKSSGAPDQRVTDTSPAPGARATLGDTVRLKTVVK